MKNPVYLFSRQLNTWDHITKRLLSSSRIVLFLDYDGTLTPIRHIPSAAVLNTETENLLKHLARLPDVHLAIVTGRSMEDIQRLIPIENVEFIANHGFHIFQNGSEWIHPQAVSLIQELKRLNAILRTALDKYPKAYIENKQFTLSIHYRNVVAHNVPSLKSLVTKTVRSLDPTLKITHGKKALEVRPRITWGKEKAVLGMLKTVKTSSRPLALYIGDDTTDEDVFRALRSKGLTIRVGKSTATNSRYYVKNVEEVMQLLRLIVAMQTSRLPPNRSY